MFNEYYDAKLAKKGKAELRFIKRKIISLVSMTGKAKNIHIHIVGVCGTAMGTFALMLRDSGFKVSGSDVSFWPPMGPLLRSSGVDILEGWSIDNISNSVDLVVVGNVCAPDHIEVLEAIKKDKPIMSMPEIIGELYVGNASMVESRKSLIIAGTHGKTTTSGLLAHMLTELKYDPTYLIGGVTQSMQSIDSRGKLIQKKGTSHHVGDGKYVVFEGDEYDTAFFDARPKFLHYKPAHSIITSLEWDHADIYQDINEYTTAFVHLFEITKESLIVSNTYPLLNKLTNDYKKKFENKNIYPKIITYGTTVLDSVIPDVSIIINDTNHLGTNFTITNFDKKNATYITPMYGEYNVLNTVSVLIMLSVLGIDIFDDHLCGNKILHSLQSFSGMKRRQEIVAYIESKNITIIDDFAHHPTAVAETLKGVRNRFPERRIVALFEPRSSTSRRKIFEQPYSVSLGFADIIGMKVPPFIPEIDTGKDLLDPSVVKMGVEKLGKKVYLAETSDELAENICPFIKDGDVLVVMSNGSFDGIHKKIEHLLI